MRFFSPRQGFNAYFIEIQLVQYVLFLSCFRDNSFFRVLHNLTCNRTDRIILRHLKRFREGRQKIAEVISEYAEMKISIHRICGWVVAEIARDSWNYIGGSSTPSVSFHVCFLRGP